MKVLNDFFQRPFVKKSARILIFLFPGASLWLLYLCRSAFRSNPLAGFSADAYVFSCFTQYWLFYTLIQRLPRRLGIFISPFVTLFFYVTITVHNQTGNMLTSYYFLDRIYEATVVARYGGLMIQGAGAVGGLILFLGLYRYWKNRMDAYRGDYNLDYRPVQILLAIVFVAHAFLPIPPAHLTYFVSSGIKRAALSFRIQNLDLREPNFSREIYQTPEYVFPLDDYPFVKIAADQVPDDLKRMPPGTPRETAFREFIKENVKNPRPRNPRPVFFLVIESVNGLYNYRKSPEGEEYTPVMNRLGREGWTVPRFYATSSSSSKGQFAVLCGILPSFLTQTSYAGWQNSFFCLPEILKRAGYRTAVFYDIEHPEFDNSEKFFRQLGFQEFETKIGADRDKVKPTHHWSWSGDRAYYRNVFQHLREHPSEKPPFIVIAVNENHWPFLSNTRRLSIEDARTPEEKFQVIRESTYNSDQAIEVFLEELEKSPWGRDALVVLMGDHSYPWGQHGFFIGGDAYEEGTRTYFTILGAGRRTFSQAVSQIDIAPTVVGLLGIEVANHFQGTSLVAGESKTRPSFFQSGNDTILTNVKLPYKYTYYLHSERETLHDIQSDPDEKDPLAIDDPAHAALMRGFRERRQLLLFHQGALLQNRFWPGY